MNAAALGLPVLVTSLAGVAAVLSSRISERLRIPAPAFFLVAAAVTADLWPRLGGLSFDAVEHIVSVALAVILFDGDMRTRWRPCSPRRRSPWAMPGCPALPLDARMHYSALVEHNTK